MLYKRIWEFANKHTTDNPILVSDILYELVSNDPDANHTHTMEKSGYDRYTLRSSQCRGLLLQVQKDADGIKVCMHGCRKYGHKNRLAISRNDETETLAFWELLKTF